MNLVKLLFLLTSPSPCNCLGTFLLDPFLACSSYVHFPTRVLELSLFDSFAKRPQ